MRKLGIKRDATQITLIAGPGERLKTIDIIKPRTEIHKPKNEDQVIELLDDISKDLFNYDLELRIQELESKFSKDLSETTFNELKELKNERKTN